MKEHLQELLAQSLLHLQRDGVLPADTDFDVQLERTRSPEHGEFASNLAMALAKEAGVPPRELAQAIINRVPRSRQVERMEIAGPGFINFFLQRCAMTGVLKDVLRQGDQYGKLRRGGRNRVTLEYVSANPTGPLHVGHGRGAAYGASLASILKFAGYKVQREYYVNDNGRNRPESARRLRRQVALQQHGRARRPAPLDGAGRRRRTVPGRTDQARE